VTVSSQPAAEALFLTYPPTREGSVLPIPLKGMKIAVSAIAEA